MSYKIKARAKFRYLLFLRVSILSENNKCFLKIIEILYTKVNEVRSHIIA